MKYLLTFLLLAGCAPSQLEMRVEKLEQDNRDMKYLLRKNFNILKSELCFERYQHCVQDHGGDPEICKGGYPVSGPDNCYQLFKQMENDSLFLR